MIHCAVRWNNDSSLTRSTTAEVIWTAVDPVPMMPIRAPSRPTWWSQRALWNIDPSKESIPSMSGYRGRWSTPVAAMTTSTTS